MLIHFFIIIITVLNAIVMTHLIYNMLGNSRAKGKNYRGEEIPVGMGMVFSLSLFIPFILYNLYFQWGETLHIFILGIIGMSFIGIIDDLLGSRDTTGLKGHIGKLFHMQLTTGGLKALMGGIISIYVTSSFSNNIFIILLNALILSLFTNLINLLDLRPGRAIKGYLFYSLILLGLFYNQETVYLLIISSIPVIIYFPKDLKAKAMMGDVGSNALGFILGFCTILYFTNILKLIILFLLICIHIYAEKSSITKLIERNPILHFIDQLGRG
ncbi:glycosyltransferase [Irregularibacter muris]|uniref:Glycosyltransferase n=1 Tax=Irregularibacter muris TaxID=1796619 RepID=A0AAE3L268_9FIRM|nr:glycosyltransferase [Irregularibacter muris]MCR1898034.1 glycosyltransferase [Irregularibacter muris]